MNERTYGIRHVLYKVTVKPDDRLEVRVYHDNHSERVTIEKNKANPHYFIEHHAAWSRAKIRAKHWMARIVDDFRPYFASSRVDFVLCKAYSYD